QRYLINNFNLAQELGAKVVRMKESSVHQGILEYVNQHNITTVCIGKPRHKLWQRISGYSWIYTLMNRLNEKHIDIIILS
ncbi:sensor protein KdpD, partial [Elizabethkingia miricola]|nr:sensor protein KdpD [Elizabethkingia miricola]